MNRAPALPAIAKTSVSVSVFLASRIVVSARVAFYCVTQIRRHCNPRIFHCVGFLSIVENTKENKKNRACCGLVKSVCVKSVCLLCIHCSSVKIPLLDGFLPGVLWCVFCVLVLSSCSIFTLKVGYLVML